MSDTSHLSRRERRQRQRRHMSILALLVAIVVLGTAGTALAFWTASSTGTASAQADTMNVGGQPSGSINGRDVTLTWAASTTASGQAVGGYTINRYSVASGGTPTAATGGCAGTVVTLTCTEQTVPAGPWYYAVTPVLHLWTGAEGPRSTLLTVTAPALSFTANQYFNASGGTLAGGTLTHFKNNETVTFHLDSSGGITLSASVSSVDGTGQAGLPTPFTVTIPGSATEGTHTVVAVGGSGSQATSNSFTVDKTAPGSALVTSPSTGSIFSAASAPTTITGSAADNLNGSGLNANSTTFTLQRPDNFYWTGTAWQSGVFNLAATNPVTTSSTASPWTSNASMPVWSGAGTPDGLYTLKATATDKAGNTFTGTAVTFTLDKTNPITASVTTPATGNTFRGTTVPASFSGSAADNSGGVGLNLNSTTYTLQRSTDNQFWSGSAWQVTASNLTTTHVATTSNAPATWTSSAAMPTWASQPDGTYTVQATARDKVGNSLTGTGVTFTLDNTNPTGSITAPTAASTVGGTTPLTATATDPTAGGVTSGITSVQFQIKAQGSGSFVSVGSATTSPYTFNWDSTTVPNGSTQVQAIITDNAGNAFTTPAVTFTVNNTFQVQLAVAGNKTAGTSFNINITALANGVTNTNYTGLHAVSFSGPANSPNGTPPTYPANATFSSGVANNVPITLTDAQTVSLQVTSGNLSGSVSVTVNANTASVGQLSNCNLNGSSVACATTFALGNNPGNVKANVSVTDAFGNTPAATTVSFTISSANGNYTVAGSPVSITAGTTSATQFTVTHANNANNSAVITVHATSGPYADFTFTATK